MIETSGYNDADVVETLHIINLDIFKPYALNGPLLVEKLLGLFLIVLKGMAKTQFEEAIRY